MVSDDMAGVRPASDEPQWGVGAGDVVRAVVLAALAAACGPFSPRPILVYVIAVPLGLIGAVWANRLRGSRRLSIATIIAFLPVFVFARAIEYDAPGRGLTAQLVVAVLAALLVLTPLMVAAIAGRRRR